MPGFFQQFYEHAVPARDEWAAIHENKQYQGVPIHNSDSDDEHWS